MVYLQTVYVWDTKKSFKNLVNISDMETITVCKKKVGKQKTKY